MWVHCGSTWVKFRVDCVCVCARACYVYDWREGEGESMMYMCVYVCVCRLILDPSRFFFLFDAKERYSSMLSGFPPTSKFDSFFLLFRCFNVTSFIIHSYGLSPKLL